MGKKERQHRVRNASIPVCGVEAFCIDGKNRLLALTIGINFDLEGFRVDANEQNIRATANLAIFYVGLLLARAEVNKGCIGLAAEGAEKFCRRLHG